MIHRCEACGRRFPIDDEALGCPACGEDRLARLTWRDDDRVHCTRCGHVFLP
jgi:predicted  nucleic acid-binding Zn-ribbon protein